MKIKTKMDEGYIKYDCRWMKAKPVSSEKIKDINLIRNRFHKIGLIGVYDNGIGFGNIIIRSESDFLITGSATGGIELLDENHYVTVNNYNLEENTLVCTGPIKASSESLSHAVIYESLPAVNAVIHVHHLELWKELMHKLPTTSDQVSYGTPDMAFEIKRLLLETTTQEQKALVMGGHEEGILVFGNSLEEAENIMLKLYNAFSTKV